MQASLEQHITDNIPNPTVGDVIGGRRTIVKDYPTLPASMQLKVLLKASDFAEMQDIMRPKYRLAFDKDILGNIVNLLELNFAKLNNHKLTLSFKPATATDEQALAALIPENAQSIEDLPTSIPAHLIRVIPQVALDEVVVKSGSPMFLGYDLTLYYQVQFSIGGTMNKEYRIPAGSYVNLMFGAGSVSEIGLNSLQVRIENTKNILASGNMGSIKFLNREKILGDIFMAGEKGFIVQYDLFNKLIGERTHAKFNLSPVFGTYGKESNVNYIFGLPIGIKQGGVSANIYTTRQIVTNENSLQTFKNFNLVIGMVTSLLEHGVPEQQFNSSVEDIDGFSTIKAIQKAITEGQSLYQIKQSNINELNNINFHPDIINEMTQAINAGYTVVTHTDNLLVPNWSGAGYVIIDEHSGNAAWKISGGSNGSFFGLCEGENSSNALCSVYTEVYECENSGDGDLTCAVLYTIGTGIIATLGAIASGVAILATIVAILATIEGLLDSNLPPEVTNFLLGLLVLVEVAIPFLGFSLVGGIFLAIGLVLIIAAFSIFLSKFLNSSRQ